MRICVMAPWPSVHTNSLLNALHSLGHEVHLLHVGALQNNGFPSGVLVHSLEPQRPMGLRYIGQLSLGLQMRRLLRRIEPDILHIHTLFAGRRWRELPWLWPLYRHHPLVVTAWGSDILVSPMTSRSARWLIQWAVRSADMILADSESVLEAAAALGSAKDRLHEMQFGIDTEVFRHDLQTLDLRDQLGLGDGPVVYSPRAFTPMYNLSAIVDAIPAVLRVVPNSHFLFQARADFHSTEYERRIRQQIKALGLSTEVRILPPAKHEELPPYYSLADIIVSVPSSDGLAMSILEAMACGAFPIVSDLPAPREWITDRENGLIVSSVEPRQIADAVLYALSDHTLTQKAAQINREIIERHFSQSVWLQRLDELYREAVAGKS